MVPAFFQNHSAKDLPEANGLCNTASSLESVSGPKASYSAVPPRKQSTRMDASKLQYHQ